MIVPERFCCNVAIGKPADRVVLMVGTTGAVFVEGPEGLTATLDEADARLLAEAILARVSAPRKTPVQP